MARRSKLGLFLKVGIVTFAIALPVFGAWLASSLAAYANGPRWILLPAALAGFPLLPGLWEAIAAARRKRTARPHILSLGDRLWLRTLAINVVFVGLLLAASPRAALRALSARGDWFLDDVAASWATPVRGGLHAIASSCDALYRLTHGSPYERSKEDDIKTRDKAPLPSGGELQGDVPKPADEPTPPPAPVPPPAPLDPAHAWPRPAELHPAVVAMQPADEASIASIAAYVVAHEPSKLGQLKALHDWVADRIAYDAPALHGTIPPQHADRVFAQRLGVCAGYAELMVALGKEAHLDIQYVVGDAKGAAGEVDGAGHAWNLAVIDGASYLLDATWDAGTVDGDRYTKKYSTEYLFTPPEWFGVDHFPQKPEQQLRTPAISRGDFMRIPQMRPQFYAEGLTLREPTRSQVTVQGSLELDVTAPAGRYLLASFSPKGGGEQQRCEVSGGLDVHAKCTFPSRGEYRVSLFSSPVRYGTYDFVGELLAQDAR